SSSRASAPTGRLTVRRAGQHDRAGTIGGRVRGTDGEEDGMSVRWIAFCAAAVFMGSAAAQSAGVASQDVERIVRAAEALVASVGGPPGPIEQMAGISRRGSLLLRYDDENRK